MIRYDAVLFDFDGVLVDSEPVHWACWMEVLSPLGIRLDWETYQRNCIGVADLAMLNFLASLASEPMDAEALRPLYPVKKASFRRKMAEGDHLAPGVGPLMQSLKGRYRLAVVTSSGRGEVEPVLAKAGLLPFLDGVIFGEDVACHKPAPEPYMKAAALIGARTPLVIEDSEAGVQSANAAGFDVVRVSSPRETAEATRMRLDQNMATIS